MYYICCNINHTYLWAHYYVTVTNSACDSIVDLFMCCTLLTLEYYSILSLMIIFSNYAPYFVQIRQTNFSKRIYIFKGLFIKTYLLFHLNQGCMLFKMLGCNIPGTVRLPSVFVGKVGKLNNRYRFNHIIYTPDLNITMFGMCCCCYYCGGMYYTAYLCTCVYMLYSATHSSHSIKTAYITCIATAYILKCRRFSIIS